jgi:hypothetical protein
MIMKTKDTLSDLFNEPINPVIAEKAKILVMACFRNGYLEDLHAGKSPVTKTGDYTDVTVTDASGRIFPFSELSRISDDEMRLLMKSAVSKLYACAMVINQLSTNHEAQSLMDFASLIIQKWDDPDDEFIRVEKQIKDTQKKSLG